MEYLPLFHTIKSRTCLLVGGGHVACRKARLLLKAGGIIRLVSPDISEDMQRILEDTTACTCQREFLEKDLDGVVLVIAATDNQETNRKVAYFASRRQIPVNVVDQPSLCSVIMPSIIDRSPIVVAVSSGGSAPVLVRKIRAQIEALLPHGIGKLAELAARFRNTVKMKLESLLERRRFWEDVFDRDIAEYAMEGNTRIAEQLLRQKLDGKDYSSCGEVYLIGAGPGDPDLLTFKALRLMQKADVVLYDHLVSDDIVDLCRRDADFIYVGKKSCQHVFSQERINCMMVELAKTGKKVIRLKGGDPFIFGRGGEELEELAKEGISFQVVPGITAASGCASYAGIPLTHRDYAQSVRFVTGHCKDNVMNLCWDEMVCHQQTLVFYMGVRNLPVICENLIKNGYPEKTPVAVIHKGTTSCQATVIGTLDTIVGIARQSMIKPPSLIIIGNVVKLHSQLNWFQPSTSEKLQMVR
ncbi:Siroheme synthase [invertebrate metagenome]|uniref:Siroheme synthase n=1 Tax=invertebrate metagenome TaxID=1711999 RepID=A0A2H9T9W0_9ZZZZ